MWKNSRLPQYPSHQLVYLPTRLVQVPMIAIIHPNTLAALGLASIIEKIMPMAEVTCFSGYAELEDSGGRFFHYFISPEVLIENAQFFLAHIRQTIILVEGGERGRLPRDFHTLDCTQSEEQLTHAFIRLAEMAHGKHTQHPSVSQIPTQHHDPQPSPLSQREIEVLQLLTKGFINKEIADKLCVSLPTVVTHRKNITDKLGIKSVSALTVYALTHGLIKVEDI